MTHAYVDTYYSMAHAHCVWGVLNYIPYTCTEHGSGTILFRVIRLGGGTWVCHYSKLIHYFSAHSEPKTDAGERLEMVVYSQVWWEMVVKTISSAARRYTFVKYMWAEIKGDEKQLIDLEWPYI